MQHLIAATYALQVVGCLGFLVGLVMAVRLGARHHREGRP